MSNTEYAGRHRAVRHSGQLRLPDALVLVLASLITWATETVPDLLSRRPAYATRRPAADQWEEQWSAAVKRMADRMTPAHAWRG